MHDVGRNVVGVPPLDGADFVADRHFELTAFHVGHLAVVVLVELADRAGLEVDLDEHDLIVVAVDLPLQARPDFLPGNFLAVQVFFARLHYFVLIRVMDALPGESPSVDGQLVFRRRIVVPGGQ